MTTVDIPAAAPIPGRRLSEGDPPPGVLTDRVFRVVALVAAAAVLAILLLIAVSTTSEAWPWFRKEGLDSVFTDNWNPSKNHFGALALLYGTLLVSGIALLFAVPVSIGIALFVTEVCPRRLRRPAVWTIDLLAAVPSVVFGLWALKVLAYPLADVYGSISDATSGVPVLGDVFADPSKTGLSFATAGLVVAIMITPIITSITREVYATVPASQKEAALALGATRWEVIRGAVFPHSTSGTVAAVMIGMGRAVGETIAVALVIGASPQLTEKIFGPGDAMASIIALNFGESTGTFRSALIGLGVVLLAITVLIGMAARGVLGRSERRLGIVK